MSKLHKVTLKPEGIVVEVEEGRNLLIALREQNTYIKSSCGGHAQHTKVRKEPDIQKLRAERAEERTKEESENLKKAETWKNHWEKTQTANESEAPKKLAGGKRPKFFDTDKVDYENNDYTRPLSPEKQKLKDERLELERVQKSLHKKLEEKTKDLPESDKDFKKFRG